MQRLTLFPQTSPLEEVWVSLDLETTGLSPDEDDIIEVGAVKFQGERTVDAFQSCVNPRRVLSDFVKRLTGISQEEVDRAPPLSAVTGQLLPFVGDAPVVGHNLAFDLGFLASRGLRLSNPTSDTWDLAFVLLPGLQEYRLGKLAASLGISHPTPHRAMDDARATRDVFVRLVEMAEGLDIYTIAEMERLASKSPWVLSYLLRMVEASRMATDQQSLPMPQPLDDASGLLSPARVRGRGSEHRTRTPPSTGATFDVQVLRDRLRQGRSLRPERSVRALDLGYVESLFEDGGPLSQAMPGFEERAEQIAMARAVADAINDGKRLIVEAGTGVGKSLAYLLPAAIYAVTNNRRVVVSTNTINLQEQLLTHDVPALVNALDIADPGLGAELRYCQLKGRANYLCLKRWSLLRASDALSDDEARLLAKVLMWLRATSTGDRSELNLSNRRAGAPWDRLSSDGAPECGGVSGACFLRASRERAAASHLIIVNHALLMTDLATGGTLIPESDVLIIDEAHHLEDEATRQLGFEVSHPGIEDYLQSVAGDRGLMAQVVAALRSSSAAASRRSTVDEVALRIASSVPGVRDAVAAMFGAVGNLVGRENGGSPRGREMRVTSGTRSQPAWSDLEMLWENADLLLADLRNTLAALETALEGLEQADVPNYESLVMEVANSAQALTEIRHRLTEFVPQPEPDGIYWVRESRRGGFILQAAPLHVGDQLEKLLFSRKDTVVLTSATLSTDGSFAHMVGRTGFAEADELLLGSPFDYPSASLLCVPKDAPEPTSWAYQEAVEQAVVDSTVAAGGSAMALFTSHAALQTTASAVRGNLQSRGFEVLAQGVDGPPHRLIERFLENPRSVLLGTASFWEGVDLAGDSLKVLLVARLPFSVPTEPVFAARSEQFEDPFSEYAVPQAILRLRQGFGRLIRTKTDMGVVVILDRRILSKRYGKSFLDSLPPSTFKTCVLHELSQEIQTWL